MSRTNETIGNEKGFVLFLKNGKFLVLVKSYLKKPLDLQIKKGQHMQVLLENSHILALRFHVYRFYLMAFFSF